MRAARTVHRLAILALVAVPSLAWVQGSGAPDKDDEHDSDSAKVSPHLNVGGHSGPAVRMAFGAGGKRLYTVGLPGELQEWDVETGDRLRVWRFQAGALRVAVAPGGKLVGVGGGSRPGKDGKPESLIWLVDVTTGQATYHGAIEGIITHDLAFSPNGDRLAAAGYHGRIEAVPRIAPGIFELFRPGSPDLYDRLLATAQSYRHRVSIIVQPANNGGYYVEVIARKELEDLPKPIRATVGGAIFRTDNNVDRQFEVIDPAFYDSLWVFKGRDVPLEQELICRIKRKL